MGLSEYFKKASKSVKEEARGIAVEAGIVEPTVLEQAKRGVKDAFKDVREELGVESGIVKKITELGNDIAEKAGIKEPGALKSFGNFMKAVGGMFAALGKGEEEQQAAVDKFNSTGKTFIKAMQGLFKSKNQEKAKETKAPAPAPKAKTAPAKRAENPELANIKARQAARKAEKGGWSR